MSFLDTLRTAFKGGGGARVPLARTFQSPWGWTYENGGAKPPFQYRSAVRHAFLDNPVAQRAVRIVAEGVGGAPVQSDTEEALALVQATSAGQSLLETLAAQLLLHGNGFVQVARDGSGKPVELFALRPERVSVVPGEDGWPKSYRYRIGDRTLELPVEDADGWPTLIHLKSFHPVDDHYGAGCLSAAEQAVAIHNASAAWNRALLENAARPSGALVHVGGRERKALRRETVMATLILTAAGTAIAGPIGAAVGTLIGSQIDGALLRPADRDGPRLQDLKVTTSSYGSPVPRHFGTMRAAGTIIWATDLKESSEKEGGGKGQPSVTTYTYSSSFAVALSSRPIAGIGRIWADGNLLRGAAGDLKVGGRLRIYTGIADQQPDPLIASAEGSACPAFRGLAYCVFEDLQLADFGNRIPALTFEVIADTGTVSLADILRPLGDEALADRPLETLEGYSDEGGALAETLATIDQVFPLASEASGETLLITTGDPDGDPLTILPDPVVALQDEGFGGASGRTQKLRADAAGSPVSLRYYDISRDFQAGLQRAGGRAAPGRHRVIEFPGAFQASNARRLAGEAAERERWAQDRLAYRVAEIDPALVPGQVVALSSKPGKWRVEAWEWRENGVELDLLRLPQRKGGTAVTEAGRSLPRVDRLATPTVLEAFELPWDGTGSADQRQVFVAASSAGAGWTGAALYAQGAAGLVPLGATGRSRSVVGTALTPMPGISAVLADRRTILDVSLVSADFILESRSVEDLAQGANRALVGEEILQFANAEGLGGGQWRLSGLLRGRGGTEHLALAGSPAGASFVLLDTHPIALDTAKLGQASALAAIGLADATPVVDAIAAAGTTLRPLAPVHPRIAVLPDGSWQLGWTRRARGAWTWASTVDAPLVEQAEAYEVGVGDPDLPLLTWPSTTAALVLDGATVTQLEANLSGQALWVRQIGTHARSLPLLLTTID